MHISRLDIFLSQLDNIREAATRGRQNSVHDGEVLPKEQSGGKEVRHRQQSGPLKDIALSLLELYCINDNVTFFQHFSAFCKSRYGVRGQIFHLHFCSGDIDKCSISKPDKEVNTFYLNEVFCTFWAPGICLYISLN